MRKSISIIVVLMGTAACLAAEAFDAAAKAARIAPYLDDQVVAVGRIDVTRIDADSVQSFVEQIARTAEPQTQAAQEAASTIRDTRKQADRWIAEFTKAGGTELIAVCSVADIQLPAQGNIAFLIAPLTPSADAGAITRLLDSGDAAAPASAPTKDNSTPVSSMVCERIGQAVFAGSKSTLQRLRTMQPASRPELEKVLEAAGDAPVQILILPSEQTRRIIEGMLPNLPEEAGGGPVTAITRGMLWAAIGIQTRPDVAFQIVIQSQDAEAAQALSRVLANASRFLRSSDVAKELPQLDEILDLCKPTVAGDRLTLALSAEAVKTAITRTMAPSLLQARERAKRMASVNNMKQIVMACFMYAAEHKGLWPENLSLVGEYLKNKEVLSNPLRPGNPSGYVYVRPAAPEKLAPQTIVLYEAHDAWGEGVGVGFADGHIEWIKDKSRFEKQLAQAKAGAAKPATP